jgi:IS30 family transposase
VVERFTRFTVLVQLDGREMDTVSGRLSVKMAELPAQLRQELTWTAGWNWPATWT